MFLTLSVLIIQFVVDLNRCQIQILQETIFFRGISSTVRRCIEKESGKEFAAKIIGNRLRVSEYCVLLDLAYNKIELNS